MSRGHAHAVIDVGVGYGEDLAHAMQVMRDTASRMRAEPAFARTILEPLEVAGVERWDASAVILRARFRVMPLEQWTVRREYLLRLHRAFLESGIDIPYPQLTVHAARPAPT